MTEFVFDVRNSSTGGGGEGVTNVGTGTGLTGGPITTTGVVSLASVASGSLLANITGSSAAPLANTLTALMDFVLGNTQGNIIYRNATTWTVLSPGTAGQALISGGASANPSWSGGTGGSVTSVGTGAGLTGGPITTTGTISFAPIAALSLLANTTGSSGVPAAHTFTSAFDSAFGSTQGEILYRNASAWVVLAPGTAGQVLQSGGAAANPSWAASGGGTVTSVGSGTGLTGGPITGSGTLSFATVTNNMMLANISGITAAPTPHTVSAVLDSAFNNTQGNILYRGASTWTYLTPGAAGTVLTSGGSSANPAWAASGGIFAPQNTIYFATGGNDSGPGTFAAPLATLAQAVTNANTLLTGGATAVSIQGLGVGIDTSNISITHSGIDIYAPGYQLNPVAGDALTVNITSGAGGSYINVVLAGSTVASGAKVLNLISTVNGNKNITKFFYLSEVVGDVYLTVQCEYYSSIVVGTLTALQAGTKAGTLYGFGSISQQTRLNLEGLSIGANGLTIQGPGQFVNNFRYPMRKITQLAGNYTLLFSDSGVVFDNATSSAFTVTLPQVSNQGTPPFNVGYEVEFLNSGSGSIAFAVQGSDVLVGATIINVAGQRAVVIEQSAGVWVVSAESASGSVTSVGTGTGLTGGPITTSGTVSFATTPDSRMLANISGSTAAPTPHTVSDVLDHVFNATQGNILYRGASAWTYLTPGTANYVLTAGGPSANPAWMPSVGNSFLYADTFWVAKNGNDSFDGKTIETPKLTINGALAAFTTPGTNSVINIVDNGIYEEQVVFSSAGNGNCYINAPAATLRTPGSSMTPLVITGTGVNGLVVNFDTIDSGSGGVSAVIASSAAGNIYIRSRVILGNVLVADGLYFVQIEDLEGNFTSSGTGKFFFNSTELNGSVTHNCPTAELYLTASIVNNVTNSNNGVIFGEIGNVTGSISGNNTNLSGNFGDNIYANQTIEGTTLARGPVNGQPLNVITWTTAQTVTLNAGNYVTYSNAFINYTGNNGYGRFDLSNDSAIPIGFQVWMYQNVNNNQTGVTSSTGAVIESASTVSGVAYTRRDGSWIKVVKVAQNGGTATFNAFGDLWQSNIQLINDVDVAVSHTTLASAATVQLLPAFPLLQFLIRNITINFGTNFAGGNRNLSITDGTNVYATITSAVLLALVNAEWGSVSVPFPTGIALNTPTVAGQGLYAVYSGGTTDYTSGSTELTIEFEPTN